MQSTKATVLCRHCKERPMAYGLATEDGSPLTFASGFCRECAPTQAEDPTEAAEIAYRMKWYNPASRQLVESHARERELKIAPKPGPGLASMLAALEKKARAVNRTMVSWAAILSDIAWPGNRIWAEREVERLTDQYNELNERLYQLENGF